MSGPFHFLPNCGRAPCVLVFIWLLAVSHANAALLAYEPFDYLAGEPIVGQNNGLGFDAPWQPGGFHAKFFLGFRMQPGALSYPGLATHGSNHLSGEAPPAGVAAIASVGRLLSTNLAVSGAKYYLSFLHRPDSKDGYSVIVLGSGQGEELAIGKPGSGQNLYYMTHRGGQGRVHSTVNPVVGKTAFIVVKMEFSDASDRFTLFINPTPGKPEPSDGVVKEDLHLELADKLFLYSRGDWSVDEIRLGTTWQDVTPAAGIPAR